MLANISLLLSPIMCCDMGCDLGFDYMKLLKLLKIVRLGSLVRYFQRILLRYEVDDKFLEIIKPLFFWIIFIHWSGCLFVIPGLIASRFRPDESVGAWYENLAYKNRSSFGQYVICWLMSVKTFTGTGSVDELKPVKYFDKIYSVILTIITRVGLFITVAYINKIIQAMKSSTLRYDEMMVQLNKYTEQNRLPPSTKAKLKDNYDSIFRKRYFHEKEILQTVSASLRQQILVHNTRQLVENSPFFENLPSFLVIKIISALSIELYLEGDVIYTSGEIGTHLYFITSGSVAFYTQSGKEVCHFSDGDYFGVLSLISDAEYQHGEVVALETTECYK